MSVGQNGVSPRRKAQWLREKTADIPPVAFAIPEDEFERLLQGFATADEAFLRKVIEAEFLARYGAVIAKMEAKRDTATENVEFLRGQREALVEHVAGTPQILPESEPALKLPRGLKGLCVMGLVFAAIAIGIFDWMSAAGFAARAETHDLALAMCFTGLIPLAAIAIEACTRRLKLSATSTGILLSGLAVISLAIFLWKFVSTYAGPQNSVTQIIQALESAEASSGIDKTALLFTQLFAGVIFGVILVSEIRSSLIRYQRDAINPNWIVGDDAISRNQMRLGKARDELAIPAGNLTEWQSSIDALVNHAIRYVTILRKRDELDQALRTHLTEGVAQLNQQLTNGNFNRNNSSNGR